MPATSTAPRVKLVLLPGLDGTGEVFRPCLERLPANITPRVVTYPADRAVSFAEHVAIARRALPTQTPFVLLAESFSGPVGLQLLAERPANLAGVIFVATFDRYPQPLLLDIGRLLPQRWLFKLFSTTPALRFFCLGCAPATTLTHWRSVLNRVALQVLSHRLTILAELPPAPAVDPSIPCLYLQPTRDRLVPARALEYFKTHFNDLAVVRIAGPHIILLADPAAGAGAIASFIANRSGLARQASSQQPTAQRT